MSHQRQIIAICQQLQQQGKTPSLALIRAKSSVTLPIPEVLAVLARFKADPNNIDKFNTPNDATTEQIQSPDALQSRVDMLEAQVKQLQQRLTFLEKQADQQKR